MNGKTIVLATDLSEAAATAARWAHQAGATLDLPVVVVHAIEVDVGGWLRTQYESALGADAIKAARDHVGGWYTEVTGTAPNHVDVRVKRAFEGLRDAAVAHDAAMIVMARSGKGTMTQTMLGSRVQALAHKPPRPLVVVDLETRIPEAGEAQSLAVGVDFSDASIAAVRFAGGMASRAGASLTIFHVADVPKVPAFGGLGRIRGIELEAIVEVAERELKALLDDPALAGVDVTTRVMTGEARDAINEISSELECSLLVMGQTGHNNPLGDLLGSTPRHILHQPPCTVAVVPAIGETTDEADG